MPRRSQTYSRGRCRLGNLSRSSHQFPYQQQQQNSEKHAAKCQGDTGRENRPRQIKQQAHSLSGVCTCVGHWGILVQRHQRGVQQDCVHVLRDHTVVRRLNPWLMLIHCENRETEGERQIERDRGRERVLEGERKREVST